MNSLRLMRYATARLRKSSIIGKSILSQNIFFSFFQIRQVFQRQKANNHVNSLALVVFFCFISSAITFPFMVKGYSIMNK